jgi:hypothetical protein
MILFFVIGLYAGLSLDPEDVQDKSSYVFVLRKVTDSYQMNISAALSYKDVEQEKAKMEEAIRQDEQKKKELDPQYIPVQTSFTVDTLPLR